MPVSSLRRAIAIARWKKAVHIICLELLNVQLVNKTTELAHSSTLNSNKHNAQTTANNSGRKSNNSNQHTANSASHGYSPHLHSSHSKHHQPQIETSEPVPLSAIESRTIFHLRYRIGYYLFQLRRYPACIEQLNSLCDDLYAIEDVKERKRQSRMSADHFLRLHLTLARAARQQFLVSFDPALLVLACEEFQDACSNITLDLSTMLRLPMVLLEYAHVLELSQSFDAALEVYARILSNFPTFRGYFDALYRSAIVGLHLAGLKKATSSATPQQLLQVEDTVAQCLDTFQFLLEALPRHIDEVHIVLLYMRCFELSSSPQQRFRAVGVLGSLFEVCRKNGVATLPAAASSMAVGRTMTPTDDDESGSSSGPSLAKTPKTPKSPKSSSNKNNKNNNNKTNILDNLQKAARDKELMREWSTKLQTWLSLGHYCLRRPSLPPTDDAALPNEIHSNGGNSNGGSIGSGSGSGSELRHAPPPSSSAASGLSAAESALFEEPYLYYEPLIARICFLKYEEEAQKQVPPGKDLSLVISFDDALFLARHFQVMQRDYATAFRYAEIGLHHDRYNRQLRELLIELQPHLPNHGSSSSSGGKQIRWSDQIQREINSATRIIRCWKNRVWTAGFRRRLKSKLVQEMESRLARDRFGDAESRRSLQYYARDTHRHQFLFEDACARRIQRVYRQYRRLFVWRETQRRHYLGRATEALHRFQKRPFSPRAREEVKRLAVHRHVSRRHPIQAAYRAIEQQQLCLLRLMRLVKTFLLHRAINRRIAHRRMLQAEAQLRSVLRLQTWLRVLLARRKIRRVQAELQRRHQAAKVLQQAYRRYRTLRKRHFLHRRLRRMHQKDRHTVMRKQVQALRYKHKQQQLQHQQQKAEGDESSSTAAAIHASDVAVISSSGNERSGKGSGKSKQLSSKKHARKEPGHTIREGERGATENEEEEDAAALDDELRWEMDEEEEEGDEEGSQLRMLLSSSASAASILQALQHRALLTLRRLFRPFVGRYLAKRSQSLTQHVARTTRFQQRRRLLLETQHLLLAVVKVQRFYRARVANFWFAVTRHVVRQRRRRNRNTTYYTTYKPQDKHTLRHLSSTARHCVFDQCDAATATPTTADVGVGVGVRHHNYLETHTLYDAVAATHGETQFLQQWRWPGVAPQSSLPSGRTVSQEILEARDTLVFFGAQDCSVSRLQLLGLCLQQRHCRMKCLFFVDCSLFAQYGDRAASPPHHQPINHHHQQQQQQGSEEEKREGNEDEVLEVFFAGLCRAASLQSIVILGGQWSRAILQRLFRLVQVENPRIRHLCIEQVCLRGGTAELLCQRAARVLQDFFNYALSSSSTYPTISSSSSPTPLPYLSLAGSRVGGNFGAGGGGVTSNVSAKGLGGLTSLSLHGCGLWDSHIALLTEGLSVTASLQSLSLSLNLLTDEGLESLVEAMQRNKRQPLRVLDLQHNLVRLSHRPLLDLLHAFRNMHDVSASAPTSSFLTISCSKSSNGGGGGGGGGNAFAVNKKAKPSFPLPHYAAPSHPSHSSSSSPSSSSTPFSASAHYRAPCVIDLRHNPIAAAFDCIASAVSQGLPATQLTLWQDALPPAVNNNNSNNNSNSNNAAAMTRPGNIQSSKLLTMDNVLQHDAAIASTPGVAGRRSTKRARRGGHKQRRTASFASFASADSEPSS